jgi:hypothetical protein
MEGLQIPDDFNHRLEYGNMWHACEEGLAAKDKDPFERLTKLVVELCEKYPLKKADIIHWYEICRIQFPVYQAFWAEHEDTDNLRPVAQELTFRVGFLLPKGRKVWLRGKFDSIDRIGTKVWLQENKTKGDIDSALMQRQLSFDLQTMLYLTAMHSQAWTGEDGAHYAPSEVAGVRYNVIRRPLSGGKGSIRQKKNQTSEEFYQELGELIKSATGPEWGVLPREHFFFMRWKVAVTNADIVAYVQHFLIPVLEMLCDWYEEQVELKEMNLRPFDGHHHFRTPYGIYSPLYDGKPTDVDEFLSSGSTVGLVRTEKLFKELAE